MLANFIESSSDQRACFVSVATSEMPRLVVTQALSISNRSMCSNESVDAIVGEGAASVETSDVGRAVDVWAIGSPTTAGSGLASSAA